MARTQPRSCDDRLSGYALGYKKKNQEEFNMNI